MLVFVFQQKTAYEMRISDWSSDVCSSIWLRNFFTGADHDPFCTSFPLSPRPWLALDEIFSNGFTGKLRETYLKGKMTELICETIGAQIGRASCRERVCQYV